MENRLGKRDKDEIKLQNNFLLAGKNLNWKPWRMEYAAKILLQTLPIQTFKFSGEILPGNSEILDIGLALFTTVAGSNIWKLILLTGLGTPHMNNP